MKKRLVVISGPTAVGKTEFAVQLAERLQTEIISADSRQIYRELQIGTAKPDASQMRRVPHHFINSHGITEAYDAGQFERDALSLIEKLFQRYDDLILCGGSGLYIRAVCEGFDEMPDVPQEVRSKIVESYHAFGLPWLQSEVAAKDPDFFDQVDQHNPQRLMRALELLEVTDKKLQELRQQKNVERPFQVVKFGLDLEREMLYRRIDARMDLMIAHGLFEEAKNFYSQRNLNALQTVGYREIFEYMDGTYDREEAVRLLKRNTRRYAKRQLTWFKRDPETIWLDAASPDLIEKVILHLQF